ncbi:MAG: Uma2 family endonuclease [Lachnospiraceae bacterium]|nr:Uma2 family endonuclease [Lachnospiraceae bacterium]
MLLDEMKRLKIQYGYSHQTIADKSGVPISTVQKVFGDITNPREQTLKKLAKAFLRTDISDGSDRPPMQLKETSQYMEGSSAELLPTTYTDKNAEPDTKLGTGSNTDSSKRFPDKTDGRYTLDDYYALPDDVRVELIDGVFYDMASPRLVHQAILSELNYQFMSAIKKNKGNCKVYQSPCDVQLDCDNKTMLQPDLFIICNKDQQGDGRCIIGAPAFIIEILSPSSRSHDMVLKLNKYKNAGVKEYWIVDPKYRKVYCYDFTNDLQLSTYTFNDRIPVTIYEGKISIDFREIYDELVSSFGEDF